MLETAQRRLFVRRKAGRVPEPAKSMIDERISVGKVGSKRQRPPLRDSCNRRRCVSNEWE
jgi:hypothetical protein